jgi:formylglycine-generating enzyme required for sulfatase activity
VSTIILRHFFLSFIALFISLAVLSPAWAKKPAPAPTPAPPPAYTLQAADPGKLPQREPNACLEPGDDLAPTLVLLPPGQFLMGSPAAETDRQSDESPQHWVSIMKPYAMTRCEITRGQFRRFVQEEHYQTIAEKIGGCYVYDPKSKQWNPDKKAYWDNPGFPQDDTHPVVCIAWQDAREYANWLSRRTGAAYRLPTEAEWEYAARAGTVSSYYWGSDSEQGCQFANLGDAELTKLDGDKRNAQCSDGFRYTAPVASYRPNHFGLYDMAGNVWEWVADCWHDNYQGAPSDGSAWEGAADCNRGVRGGSWYYVPQDLRSAYRIWFRPNEAFSLLGFRLARAL